MFKLFSRGPSIEEEAIQWLARLQSPNLTSQQETSFFCWLDKSTAHQAAYVNAESTWQRGEALASIPRPEGITQNKKRLDFRIPSFDIPKIVAPIAAASVFVLLLGLEFFNPFSLYTNEVHETQIGEHKKIVLDDGSTLILNTNSSISITFDRSQRLVQLNKGEVYFEIEKDQNRPFDVSTSSGSVRVLGTRFSVFDNEKDIIVTVVEGKVSLSDELTSSKSFTSLSTLTENQRLSMGQARSGLDPIHVNAKSKIAWVKNKLIYQGETLQEVILDINRYYQSKLVLGEESLSNKAVIAVLQLDDFSSTLNALKSSLNLTSSVDSELQYITLSSHPDTQ
ncbi:MAG: FecR domain-containing protein [Agarilytica sp.]